ncbi:MAG: hypothetical protein ACREQ7_16950 [Candidatus Binatia bacterium]
MFNIAFHFVTIPERPLHLNQIFDVQARAERVTAAATTGALSARPHIFIKTNAELRRPLENMEELAERKPQERKDHGHRMHNGEEIIGVALHSGVAGRQEKSGNANGKQQDQRQEIFRKQLRRCRASIAHAPASRQYNTGDDQKGGPHKPMENQHS